MSFRDETDNLTIGLWAEPLKDLQNTTPWIIGECFDTPDFPSLPRRSKGEGSIRRIVPYVSKWVHGANRLLLGFCSSDLASK